MRKIIIILLTLCIVISYSAIPCSADANIDVIYSGTCGNDLSWSIDSYGRLIISGEGTMEDYSTDNLSPWHPFRSEILSISIDEGVTSIGSFAFSQCSNVQECMVPKTISYIGSYAFKECQSLQEISIPEGITRVSYGCFDGCTNLETVNLPSTIE